MSAALKTLGSQPQLSTGNKGYVMYKKAAGDRFQGIDQAQPVKPTVAAVEGGGLGMKPLGSDSTSPVAVILNPDGSYNKIDIPDRLQGKANKMESLQWCFEDTFPQLFCTGPGMVCRAWKVRPDRLDSNSYSELVSTEFDMYVASGTFSAKAWDSYVKRKHPHLRSKDSKQRLKREDGKKRSKSHRDNKFVYDLFQIKCKGSCIISLIKRSEGTAQAENSSSDEVFVFGSLQLDTFKTMVTNLAPPTIPHRAFQDSLTISESQPPAKSNRCAARVYTNDGVHTTPGGFLYHGIKFVRSSTP